MGALRLILALSVVMSHGVTTLAGIPLFDAAGAVWVFFAISGFLITVALHLKYRPGPGQLAAFYRNRALRLLPSYWVWLLLTLACYALMPAAALTYQRFVIDGSANTLRFWADHASQASWGTLLWAALANLTGLFADAFLYLSFDPASGTLQANPAQDGPIWAMGFIAIGQYWSIGIELCFYAIAPWVVRRRSLTVLLFSASVSGWLPMAWSWLAKTLALPPALGALQAPKFLWMFMLGAMAAQAYLAWRQRRGLLGPALLLAGMYLTISVRAPALFPLAQFPWWLFALLTAAVPVLFHATRENRVDGFLGELSYPVYVNHFVLIQLLGTLLHPSGLLFAGAAVFAAAATVALVEHRARWLKVAPPERPSADTLQATEVVR